MTTEQGSEGCLEPQSQQRWEGASLSLQRDDTRFWTSSLQTEVVRFCCLKSPVCGTLFQQPRTVVPRAAQDTVPGLLVHRWVAQGSPIPAL